MKLIFLGTASSFPTKERNHTAVLLEYAGEALLFDCGEGTQRQIKLAEAHPMKIEKIFITHWHGDHCLGLPGFLESMAFSNRTKPIYLFGPVGTKEHLFHLMKGFAVRLPFKLDVHEISAQEPRVILETPEYEVLAVNMKHRVPTLAFAFKEKSKIRINLDYTKKFGLEQHPILKKLQEGKDITWQGKKIKAKDATYKVEGKKVAYVVDTEPNANAVKLAKDSDVFVCEGTFANELKAEANEKCHMTVKQAAKLAKDAEVKKLVLTHFSQRYKHTTELEREASSVFKNVVMAKDLMEVKI